MSIKRFFRFRSHHINNIDKNYDVLDNDVGSNYQTKEGIPV